MLTLTFQIGSERVALDVRQVLEVVPWLRLLHPTGAPLWLAGLFVYHGQVVPVLDLHCLVQAGECPHAMSSRIILVRLGEGEELNVVGLLAAQVIEVRQLARATLLPSPTEAGQPDFGPAL